MRRWLYYDDSSLRDDASGGFDVDKPLKKASGVMIGQRPTRTSVSRSASPLTRASARPATARCSPTAGRTGLDKWAQPALAAALEPPRRTAGSPRATPAAPWHRGGTSDMPNRPDQFLRRRSADQRQGWALQPGSTQARHCARAEHQRRQYDVRVQYDSQRPLLDRCHTAPASTHALRRSLARVLLAALARTSGLNGVRTQVTAASMSASVSSSSANLARTASPRWIRTGVSTIWPSRVCTSKYSAGPTA